MAINEMEVIIISDRHQGIIRSVSEVFKFEYHAYCYRRVKENFNSSLTKSNTQGRNEKENALEIIKNVAYAWLNVQYVVALETLQNGLRTIIPSIGFCQSFLNCARIR